MIRASDSRVRPIPMKSMACDQSKKDPIAPITINRIPKENKEITLLFISVLFSIERNEVGDSIIETEAKIIDVDPLKSRYIEVFEIVGFTGGQQYVSPE